VVEVPRRCVLGGAQTQRFYHEFFLLLRILIKMPKEIIAAFAYLKKGCGINQSSI
jgi:fumarate hydratase class II